MKEKANKGPLLDPSRVVARTVKATNVSEATVRRICSSANEAHMTKRPLAHPVFSSTKNRPAIITIVDDFDKHVVSRTVLVYYARKEIPKLHKVKEELKENISLKGCTESLQKIRKEIGFRHEKNRN